VTRKLPLYPHCILGSILICFSACVFSLAYPVLWVPYYFVGDIIMAARLDPARKVLGPVRLFQLVLATRLIIVAPWIWNIIYIDSGPLWFDDHFSSTATTFRIFWGLINGSILLFNIVEAMFWWVRCSYPSLGTSKLVRAFWKIYTPPPPPLPLQPPPPPPYYP
jgi:hypothetical protein